MLVEDFVYSGTLSIINPYSPVYHVVESDSGGMIPASLKAVLGQWGDGEEAEPDRPKVISIKEYFLYLFQALYPSALSVPSAWHWKQQLSKEIKYRHDITWMSLDVVPYVMW